MDTELNNLYDKLSVNGKCELNDKCWPKTCESGRRTIYKPYIGRKYAKNRVLCLGINFNDYGDELDAMIKLMELAKSEFKLGKKQIFKNTGYQGSIVYHRMLAYTQIWMNSNSHFSLSVDWTFPSESLVDTLECVAITNTIKCSPKGNNSAPLPNMWENCPKHILKNEINILKPKRILLLGKSENYKSFFNILSHPKRIKENISFKIFNASIQNNNFEILVAPHPSYEGRKQSNYDDIAELLDIKDEISIIKNKLTNRDYYINSFRTKKYIELFYRPYKYWLEIWFYDHGCELWLANYKEEGKELVSDFSSMDFKYNGKEPNKEGKYYYHVPDQIFDIKSDNELNIMLEKIKNIMELLKK